MPAQEEGQAGALAAWDMLEPYARQQYAIRVCVLGAESTGTTTLARALAQHYKTCWVPEYLRVYYEGRMHSPYAPDWHTPEFGHMVQVQNAMEDALARVCNRLLFCDTDAFALRIWHERYVGHLTPELETNGVSHTRLYLVTDIDVPFVQDGFRDGEHVRHVMHERFVEELQLARLNYLVISGTEEERMAKAVAACDALLEG